MNRHDSPPIGLAKHAEPFQTPRSAPTWKSDAARSRQAQSHLRIVFPIPARRFYRFLGTALQRVQDEARPPLALSMFHLQVPAFPPMQEVSLSLPGRSTSSWRPAARRLEGLHTGRGGSGSRSHRTNMVEERGKFRHASFRQIDIRRGVAEAYVVQRVPSPFVDT